MEVLEPIRFIKEEFIQEISDQAAKATVHRVHHFVALHWPQQGLEMEPFCPGMNHSQKFNDFYNLL